MSKHTKGEWRVSSSTLVVDEESHVIADTLALADVPELRLDIREASANAILIAAAPDLLTACIAQEAANDWFGPSDTGRELIDSAKIMIHAAILKAKK